MLGKILSLLLIFFLLTSTFLIMPILPLLQIASFPYLNVTNKRHIPYTDLNDTHPNENQTYSFDLNEIQKSVTMSIIYYVISNPILRSILEKTQWLWEQLLKQLLKQIIQQMILNALITHRTYQLNYSDIENLTIPYEYIKNGYKKLKNGYMLNKPIPIEQVNPPQITIQFDNKTENISLPYFSKPTNETINGTIILYDIPNEVDLGEILCIRGRIYPTLNNTWLGIVIHNGYDRFYITRTDEYGYFRALIELNLKLYSSGYHIIIVYSVDSRFSGYSEPKIITFMIKTMFN